MSRGEHFFEELAKAVRAGCKCHASHKESVHVKETYGGKLEFDGDVHVFDLTGHPKATKAYAFEWNGKHGDIRRAIFLNSKLVESPATAVRAAVASGKYP